MHSYVFLSILLLITKYKTKNESIRQTSLLVEAMIQDPVTVRLRGEEEPSTLQSSFSYLMSSFGSTGAKVTSKGTFLPGRIQPAAGVMDTSGGKLAVSQLNL